VRIQDKGALGIAKGLLVNVTLKELDISHNILCDFGIAAIYSTAFDNKKSLLGKIDIQKNKV